MSEVLASRRNESKWEPITYASELHDMLIDLMQRNFGVKDLEQLVRVRYARGIDNKEDFAFYRFLMHEFKININREATLLTSNLRAANTIHPTTMDEYETRRGFQNLALTNCETIIKELHKIIERFDIDLNVYEKYSKAIDREIDLIKRWRQRDNRFKSYVK